MLDVLHKCAISSELVLILLLSEVYWQTRYVRLVDVQENEIAALRLSITF